MDNILKEIINNAQSAEQKKYEKALLDLRLIIERHTQNRYSDKEKNNYLLLFYDKNLINYRLHAEDLDEIKYFLFFVLFNFPDRAVLVAKCIKVLFDKNIREAICAAIEIYLKKGDDDTTCELIFAITNVGDEKNYLSNKRIIDLFILVSKFGGEYSKEAAKVELKYYNDHYQ